MPSDSSVPQFYLLANQSSQANLSFAGEKKKRLLVSSAFFEKGANSLFKKMEFSTVDLLDSLERESTRESQGRRHGSIYSLTWRK